MPFEIRRATAEDIPRALNFYAEQRYAGEIRSEDTVLLAELDGAAGVRRRRGCAARHAGSPKVSAPGIGKKLLATVAHELAGRGCFCIPYAHLIGFYGGIGLQVIEPAKALTFLRLRPERYQNRGDGKEYLIRRREE